MGKGKGGGAKGKVRKLEEVVTYKSIHTRSHAHTHPHTHTYIRAHVST